MQLSCLAVNSNRWTFLHRALWVLSHFSRVWLFGTLWTAAHHTPQSMGFSRKEYCSGLPWPSPGDLPNPGIEPASLVSPALAGGFFTTSATNVLVKLGHFSSPAYGHVWGFGIVCVCVCMCARAWNSFSTALWSYQTTPLIVSQKSNTAYWFTQCSKSLRAPPFYSFSLVFLHTTTPSACQGERIQLKQEDFWNLFILSSSGSSYKRPLELEKNSFCFSAQIISTWGQPAFQIWFFRISYMTRESVS